MDVKELLNCSFININKPSGPTSHQVSDWVSKILKTKCGHSGTLDPKVIGVLPIGIGKATYLLRLLLNAPKTYVGIMRLHKNIDLGKVENIFKEFEGEIYQIPPIKSSVRRRLRIRRIYSLKLIEKDGKDILFECKCSAGTYIRKLIHDMGLALGCGAHMEDLIRTETGPFKFKDCCILQNVLDYYIIWKKHGIDKYLKSILIPIEILKEVIPYVVVHEKALFSVSHGTILGYKGILEYKGNFGVGSEILLVDPDGKVFGIGKVLNEIESKSKHLIKPDRILKQYEKV